MANLIEIYNKFNKELSSIGAILDEILILEELLLLEKQKEYGLTKSQIEKLTRLAWRGYLKFDGNVNYGYVAQAIVNYWLEEKEDGMTFDDFVDNFDRWLFCEYLCEVL